jgi:hypothetical protein
MTRVNLYYIVVQSVQMLKLLIIVVVLMGDRSYCGRYVRYLRFKKKLLC